jgi:hypothetical protein
MAQQDNQYQINAPVDKIFALYVKQYSIQYSKIDDTTIHVSCPDFAENITIANKSISFAFISLLLDRGWTNKAIDV